MGIRADKLFRLILKTDLNKYKIESYRRKLGISKNDNESIDSDSDARMVSRGPFIAIFKHESITFVNSLENVARPLTERRKKRKKHKFTNSADNSTVQLTIKSAPAGSRPTNEIHYDDDATYSKKSHKRKKIEDKTGMIIVAEVDHDEMSTVSVSPTNVSACPQIASAELLQGKPLSLIAGNYTSKSHDSKKARKDCLRSSRKKARKNKKKRSSLRSIKSVGHSSDEHDEENDSLSSTSLFSNPTVDTSTTVSSSQETFETHERSPSNLETVDIREVLEENSLGARAGAFRFTAHAPYHPNPMSFGHPTIAMNTTNPYYHQEPLPVYGLPHGHPYSQHEHSMYSHPHHPHPYDPTSHLNWQHDPYYQNVPHYNHGRNNENIEYEECFLIKGFTSFLKKMFGIEKKQELFVPSPDRNPTVFHDPTLNHHINVACQTQQKWQFEAPARPRTRSRVFSECDDSLSHQMDHDTSESTPTFENRFDSLHTKAKFIKNENENEKQIDARLLTYQEDRGNRASCEVQVMQPLGTTQAMEAWKASGPSNIDTKSSIMDDFNFVGAKRLKASPNLSDRFAHDDAVHNEASQKRKAMSDIKDVPSHNHSHSHTNANVVPLRRRTISSGNTSSNTRRSVSSSSVSSSSSSSSSGRSRRGRSSGFSVLKDETNGKRKRTLLERPCPKPLSGIARSKSDGTRLSRSTSSGSSRIFSTPAPSMISRSTSVGSSSLQSQQRIRASTRSTENAGGFFHYR